MEILIILFISLIVFCIGWVLGRRYERKYGEDEDYIGEEFDDKEEDDLDDSKHN